MGKILINNFFKLQKLLKMLTQKQKTTLALIAVEVEEKINAFHKERGETMNSRQILQDFIFAIHIDFDRLAKSLDEELEPA